MSETINYFSLESPVSVAVGEKLTPSEAMKVAILEGQKGTGFVSPNPLVGCVILDSEFRVLAIGHHVRVGYDHAEIDALRKITDQTKLIGAHLFVTLEPCAHQGRTGSCARAIAPLGVSSVTYAIEDPNPLVAGQGAAILREAGVTARVLRDRVDIPADLRADLTDQAEDLAEIFLHNMRSKRLFVAAKVGSSMDGKMGVISGESKWITGAEAREHSHQLRARYDAVLIGRNTFVADNPSLNVRLPEFPNYRNKVVLFDPQGRTLSDLPESNLVKVRDPDQVWVVVGEGIRVRNPADVQIVEVPLNDRAGFDTHGVIARLKTEGLSSIMIEGGSQTYANFFNAGLVDRLHAYIAPCVIGGRHGVAWSAGFGGETMAERLRLRRTERRFLGDDVYWTGRIEGGTDLGMKS